MQSSQDKKSKIDASEELQRRTIAAQIKLEEKRLQLEIQIRKKNEEEKQKALLKKQQKEAMANQRKDAKIENPSRSDVSRLSKDSEVKDSLSQEKADEIQNNLQSLIKSKTFEPFSAEDEPNQALEGDIENSDKQDSDRNDSENAIQIENKSRAAQKDRREGRYNENKFLPEKVLEGAINKRDENLESHHERAATERIYARQFQEDSPVEKTEFKVGGRNSQKHSDRDDLIKRTTQNSNPDNFVVSKNNLLVDQIKMETNVTVLKEDRDPLGGAVKLQLELANQMKKFKLDEEKRKKNKEEAGLQRKHEILRQIKGTGMGQSNLDKPDDGQLDSLSSAEKDRSIRGSQNFERNHEKEDVRRENKFSELKATLEAEENAIDNHQRMSQRKSDQSNKEPSEEEIQYGGESSESEGPIEKENGFEQSRGNELLNDSQQYNKITKPFNSQRNDLDTRMSQQRSSGGYDEIPKRDYLTSNERNEDIQEHPPQSYAQLHARKNQDPEMKVFKPDSEEGLSKLLKSYERGDPEEDREYYRALHEDSKRQDDIELNYSQSERELEDTNQNPLLTFGRKDFNKKDEGLNPLILSNSFKKSLQEPERIPKTQIRPVMENKDDDYRNDNNQRDKGDWGYNPKTNIEIQQTSDIRYKSFEEEEEDGEDYEYGHETPQNEDGEEEHSNGTGDFANNVDREQNLSEEDYPDQKPYYIANQHQTGTFSGSGQKKKELIRYGDEQMANEDDFTSGNFGYKGQDKSNRARKGWGDTKNDENSSKNPTSVNSIAPIEDEGNEYDEEDYGSGKRSREEIVAMHKEDQKHEDDRKSEHKLITFDDAEDETTRQRKMKKFENFMQRRQEDQERMKDKKEKEKAKKAQNQHHRDEITFANVSEEGTPQNSKRPISREKYSKNVKQDQVPIISNKMRPPSGNVRNQEKLTKKDPHEELKSVEASAKSNKSEMKSPNAPNNIFVPQRPSISGKKEFSKPSNKQNIKNAITNVCLAGEPNRKEREEVLSKLDEFKNEANFIIAFNAISARLIFKAVYAYDSLTGVVKKIYSNGTVPDLIDSNAVVNYYNYNNGPKEFKPIQGNKNFSLRVDAVSLQPQLFRKPTSQNLF